MVLLYYSSREGRTQSPGQRAHEDWGYLSCPLQKMYASSWGRRRSTQTTQTVILSHLQAAVGFPSMSKQGHSKHQSPFECILENNTYYHELVFLSLLYLMTGMFSFRKWIFMRGSATQIGARLLLVSQHCIFTSPSLALMVHYLWCCQLTPTLLRSLILAHTAARPSQRPWGRMAAAGAKGRRRSGIPVPQGSPSGAQSWVRLLRHTLLLPSHQIWIFLRNTSRFLTWYSEFKEALVFFLCTLDFLSRPRRKE